MTKDEWKEKLIELKGVLAERLKYNNNWENVHLKVKKTFLEIKWFNHKKDDIYDPKGKVYFKTVRVAPLNKKTLWKEVERQYKKLKEDEISYKGDDADVG